MTASDQKILNPMIPKIVASMLCIAPHREQTPAFHVFGGFSLCAYHLEGAMAYEDLEFHAVWSILKGLPLH